METLEALHKGFVCKIGKRNGDMVNIFTNFNPTEHWVFVQALKMTDGIGRIANISDYGNGTGGLAVEISPVHDEMYLRDMAEKCMKQFM